MLKILLPAFAVSLAAAQSTHFSDVRQLTHGGQNAEAYWAPDGKRLIFQTTRPPYECDQIFIMNADGSDQHLVSTGKGRTTCGYFLGDNKHIVYASTHVAGDACPDAARSQQGLRLGRVRRLRYFSGDRRRQDREAPDRRARLRCRSHRQLEDRKRRCTRRWPRAIWTCGPCSTDGSHKKQLTNTPGYDGGPVFSRDGKKMVWRANYPKTPEDMAKYKSLLAENLTAPMKMEIDGGAMPMAATPTPSPISAAPVSLPRSRPTARRFCSPPTSTTATAATSSCT